MDNERDAAPTERRLLLCDCEGSQAVDGARICAALGATRALEALDPKSAQVHTALCAGQADVVAHAVREAAQRDDPQPVLVACAQEAARFDEIADEHGGRALALDIRDRAGWSDDATEIPQTAAAKMAALLAVGAAAPSARPEYDVPTPQTVLVLGSLDHAVEAAERLQALAGVYAITVMATDAPETAAAGSAARGYDLVRGRVASASGAVSDFALGVDGFAALKRGGRGDQGFEPARDGATTRCDLIIDVSGEPPLFPAAHKRDGYFRADPRDPIGVERIVSEAAGLAAGGLAKTLFVSVSESLCAHARAGQTGCTRCLDVCPTGAILAASGPSVEHVTIDAAVCAGCGACSAVCPTGAVRYDAPSAARDLDRLRLLVETFQAAGGDGARVMLHAPGHVEDVVALAARYGRGLPADVLPLALEGLAKVDHAMMLAAIGLGARQVVIALGPQDDAPALAAQAALAATILDGVGVAEASTRFVLIEASEPDAFAETLRAPAPAPHDREKVLPLGEGRALTRHVARALMGDAPPPLELGALDPAPAGGAPYAAVLVDQEACTLCLSCVSLCPAGALGDREDAPELRFQETACLNCGICRTICPESAITLQPRLDLSDGASQWRALKSEEPFACIECGKLFGVKSTIEKISEKLGGAHWMYQKSDNLRLIQMCDDCRVRAQFHASSAPFKLGTPRKQRTTEDYLRERDAEQADDGAVSEKPKNGA